MIAHPGDEEEELEYILDLLPAVPPAGDRAATAPRRARAVVALERAGVDAISSAPAFCATLTSRALSRS